MIPKSKACSYGKRSMKSTSFPKVNFMKILLFGLLMVMQICSASKDKLDQKNFENTNMKDKNPDTNVYTETNDLKRKAESDIENEEMLTDIRKETKKDENDGNQIAEIELDEVILNETEDNGTNLDAEDSEGLTNFFFNNVDPELLSLSNIPQGEGNFLTNYKTIPKVNNDQFRFPEDNTHYEIITEEHNELRHQNREYQFFPNYNPAGHPSYQYSPNYYPSNYPFYGNGHNYQQPIHYNPYFPPPQLDMNPLMFYNNFENYNNQKEETVEKISSNIVEMGNLVVESDNKDKVFKRKNGTVSIPESELDENFHQYLENIDRYDYSPFKAKLGQNSPFAIQASLEKNALILEEYYKIYYNYAMKYLFQKITSQNLPDAIVRMIVNYLTGPRPQSTIIIQPDLRKTASIELSNLVESSFNYRNLLFTKTKDPSPIDRMLFYPVPGCLPPFRDQNTLSMLNYYFKVDHYCLDLFHTQISYVNINNEDGQKLKVIVPFSAEYMWVKYPESVKCILPEQNNYCGYPTVVITSSSINSRDNGLFIFAHQPKTIEISHVNLGGLYFPRHIYVESQRIQIHRCPYVNWKRINLPSNVSTLEIRSCDTNVVSTIETMIPKMKDQVQYLKLVDVNINRLDLTSFSNLKQLFISYITSNTNEINWNLIKLPATNDTVVEFEIHEYVQLGSIMAKSHYFFNSLTHLRLQGNCCSDMEQIVYPPHLKSLTLDVTGRHNIQWATNLPSEIELIALHIRIYQPREAQELVTCDLTAFSKLAQFSVKLINIPESEQVRIENELFDVGHLKVNSIVKKELHFVQQNVVSNHRFGWD